jgi:MFS family permease
MIGVGSTVGRFVLGGMADRFGRRRSFAAMFLGVALSCAWWLLAGSRWELFGFSLMFGLFYGGFVSLGPAIIADYFGFRNVSTLIGLLYSSVAAGSLVGPPLAGYIFDFFGSYDMPITIAAVTCFVAFLLAFLLEDPAR